MAMVELYAINIQLPPANEFGPSADELTGRVVSMESQRTT